MPVAVWVTTVKARYAPLHVHPSFGQSCPAAMPACIAGAFTAFDSLPVAAFCCSAALGLASSADRPGVNPWELAASWRMRRRAHAVHGMRTDPLLLKAGALPWPRPTFMQHASVQRPFVAKCAGLADVTLTLYRADS